MRSDPYWWHLKDLVKRRAGGRCEHCRRRGIHALHHRTYARKLHEDPRDVMGVCRACHKAIHGLWPFGHTILVAKGSLADLGDPGLGMTAAWVRYLARVKKKD